MGFIKKFFFFFGGGGWGKGGFFGCFFFLGWVFQLPALTHIRYEAVGTWGGREYLSLTDLIITNCSHHRSPCMRPRSDPPKMKNSNVVRSRLIILINEEINEANWMVSNNAKLDRRTKQHTQFGVSASNGSRDMARTKSWRKKRKKKKKITKRIGW